MRERRGADRVLVGRERERDRDLGRPRRRWEDITIGVQEV
jgi:hypothetical protein